MHTIMLPKISFAGSGHLNMHQITSNNFHESNYNNNDIGFFSNTITVKISAYLVQFQTNTV